MAMFIPRDRKSLFRQFLSGMYDAVVITDPNGHVIEINARAVEHFGYGDDELLDRPVSVIIPGLATDVVQRIRKGLEDDRHIVIDANGRTKDGRKIACEVTVSGIDLLNPGDLVFTIRNTERRRELMASLRARANAFALSHESLFACDAEGRFTTCNQAFLDMFGFADLSSALAQSFGDVMPDEPLAAAFRKALGGEDTVTGLVAETDEDGAELEITLVPNRLGRKIVGVVGAVRDLKS